MESLSGAWRRGAYEKVRQLCDLRLEGTHSEEEIKKKLEFGSLEAMHTQLKNWGVSGLLTNTDETVDTGNKRRKASSSGDAKGLPNTKQAERLFRADYMLLTHYMNQIPALREHLQGNLRVSSSWVGEDWEYYRRDEFSEEEWRRLCDEQGEDSTEEIIRTPISPWVHHGAGPAPWEGLVLLIAMHALMRGEVDRLVDALHPRPDEADRGNLWKRLHDEKHGLIGKAVSLAKEVRGIEVKPGRQQGVIAPFEMNIALTVRNLKEEGLSTEEIFRELKEQGWLDEEDKYWVESENEPARKEKYTLDDLKRHIKLGLLPPD